MAPPQERRGALTVVCYPACDEVVVDRKPAGPSPVFKLTVPFGLHHIVLRTSDPPVTRALDVVVQSEETAVVRQSMR